MSSKPIRILGSAILFLWSVTFLSPTPAQASFDNCDFPRLQRFGAVIMRGTNGFQIEGASADMRYRYGNICTTDTDSTSNFSTAWTMASSKPGNAYAQSGLMYQYGWPCWRHFAEQRRSPTVLAFRSFLPTPCVANGETHRAWQQVVNLSAPACCDWRIRSNIDSTIMQQSAWNPFANWETPFNAEFAGETTHSNSDIPGYKLGGGWPPPTAFTFISVQSLHDDNWYSSCGRTNTTRVTAPRYNSSVLGCDSTESWTSG